MSLRGIESGELAPTSQNISVAPVVPAREGVRRPAARPRFGEVDIATEQGSRASGIRRVVNPMEVTRKWAVPPRVGRANAERLGGSMSTGASSPSRAHGSREGSRVGSAASLPGPTGASKAPVAPPDFFVDGDEAHGLQSTVPQGAPFPLQRRAVKPLSAARDLVSESVLSVPPPPLPPAPFHLERTVTRAAAQPASEREDREPSSSFLKLPEFTPITLPEVSEGPFWQFPPQIAAFAEPMGNPARPPSSLAVLRAVLLTLFGVALLMAGIGAGIWIAEHGWVLPAGSFTRPS